MEINYAMLLRTQFFGLVSDGIHTFAPTLPRLLSSLELVVVYLALCRLHFSESNASDFSE